MSSFNIASSYCPARQKWNPKQYLQRTTISLTFSRALPSLDSNSAGSALMMGCGVTTRCPNRLHAWPGTCCVHYAPCTYGTRG